MRFGGYPRILSIRQKDANEVDPRAHSSIQHAAYSIQNTANKHAGIQGYKDAGYKDAKDTGYRSKATPRSLVAPLSRGRRIYFGIFVI